MLFLKKNFGRNWHSGFRREDFLKHLWRQVMIKDQIAPWVKWGKKNMQKKKKKRKKVQFRERDKLKFFNQVTRKNIEMNKLKEPQTNIIFWLYTNWSFLQY